MAQDVIAPLHGQLQNGRQRKHLHLASKMSIVSPLPDCEHGDRDELDREHRTVFASQVEAARAAVTQAAADAYSLVYIAVGLSQKSTHPSLIYDAVNHAVWLKLPNTSSVSHPGSLLSHLDCQPLPEIVNRCSVCRHWCQIQLHFTALHELHHLDCWPRPTMAPIQGHMTG